MERYFVQRRDPDGEISISVNNAEQICEFIGFSDCTGCDYEVFKSEEFGKLVRLEYVPATAAPFNYHVFINSETGEVEIEGYSREH